MSLLGWPGIRRIFCRRNLLLNMVTMLSSTTKGFLISILISQVQFGMSDTYWLQKICKHTVKHLQKICTTPCPINQMWNASRWKIFLGQAVKILCNSWKSTQFCVSWYNQFLFWLLRIKRKVCSAINFCTLTRGEPFSSFWGEIYKDIHIECSKQFEWDLYFYVSGQSRQFWAVLKLLSNSKMKFIQATTNTIQCMWLGISLKSERNIPWFKPWFNILLHSKSIVCATV